MENKNLKIILSAAGTGGHIYPLLSIAHEIRKRKKDVEFLFIGSREEYEKPIFISQNIKYCHINIIGLNRKNPLKMFSFTYKYFNNLSKIKKIITDFNPSIVITTGGYITYPVVKIAKQNKIKTYIHEQNAFMGLANKKAASVADKIFISFDETRKQIKTNNVILSGNPVREEFTSLKKKRSSNFKVLVFGGSLGSKKINNITVGAINKIKDSDIRFTLIAGTNDYENVKKMIKINSLTDKRLKLIEYSNDIWNLMNEADLLICRSGASTVSEIICMRKVAIFVPFPFATNDHQFLNAKTLADKNAAVVIKESELTAFSLMKEIERIKKHSFKELQKNIMEIPYRDAKKIIVDEIEKDMNA